MTLVSGQGSEIRLASASQLLAPSSNKTIDSLFAVSLPDFVARKLIRIEALVTPSIEIDFF